MKNTLNSENRTFEDKEKDFPREIGKLEERLIIYISENIVKK